ncbi:MAG: hypothetical protein Q8936_20940 [Bacillota bacterium]|nr:hypothetical protein [Bacillota bacterium]
MHKVKKGAVITSVVIILILSLARLFLGTDLGNNIVDSIVWSEEKKLFNEESISKISFYAEKAIDLTGEEKKKFISNLKSSKFYRNNEQRQVDGGLAIIIFFKDGSKESLEYCGASVFQIQYKGRIFSIKNKELEQILLEHEVSL